MTSQTASVLPAPAPTVATRWTLSTHDIDAYASGQNGWHLACDMLSGGSFAGFLDHVQLPGLRLVRETTNRALRQHGEMNPDCCGFALTCRQDGEARFSGQRLDTESVMVGRCDELDLCSPPGFELTGIVVDNALLQSLTERLNDRAPPAWLERRVVLHFDAPTMQSLRGTLRGAFSALDAMPGLLDDPVATVQLRDDVLLAWLNALPEDVDLRELRATEAHRRVVRRACELMMSRPDEPLSMLQVCSRIGASQRKLNYCFQETLGLSPARYLRALRLNGVRRALKRPESRSVQDIAAHWGFWHLSQFATDYRRQFGELPSQTLRGAALTRH
ncbi:AraC family transcriptional regulator [Variovorax boronicumulans]|uniref:AraC family transcriptional regulator n=1 Tax=Variovorax boronicumulans TaxID=436515 RepID=A0A250DCX0_9BURK|nr:helix-turn-helix domain-containing protein [Variovorax boronicumulans]ATA52218.1 AraC family transcriptional regulator [Variovorax boronicumulans]